MRIAIIAIGALALCGCQQVETPAPTATAQPSPAVYQPETPGQQCAGLMNIMNDPWSTPPMIQISMEMFRRNCMSLRTPAP